MNSLVRPPVEGEPLGPAKTEHLVNVIVGGIFWVYHEGVLNFVKCLLSI